MRGYNLHDDHYSSKTTTCTLYMDKLHLTMQQYFSVCVLMNNNITFKHVFCEKLMYSKKQHGQMWWWKYVSIQYSGSGDGGVWRKGQYWMMLGENRIKYRQKIWHSEYKVRMLNVAFLPKSECLCYGIFICYLKKRGKQANKPIWHLTNWKEVYRWMCVYIYPT